jgi:hypothetical protein
MGVIEDLDNTNRDSNNISHLNPNNASFPAHMLVQNQTSQETVPADHLSGSVQEENKSLNEQQSRSGTNFSRRSSSRRLDEQEEVAEDRARRGEQNNAAS